MGERPGSRSDRRSGYVQRRRWASGSRTSRGGNRMRGLDGVSGRMATSVRAQPLVAWTLALVAGAGVGCSWRRPGFPHQSYDTKQQIRDLEKTFDLSQMIRDYYDDKVTPPERKRDARDKLVSARL